MCSTPASSTDQPANDQLAEFMRRWHADREEPGRVGRSNWRATVGPAEPPGPAEVLPALPAQRLKIECLPAEPGDTLPFRVKRACANQAKAGLRLSSTFCHDGSLFLVFKRL